MVTKKNKKSTANKKSKAVKTEKVAAAAAAAEKEPVDEPQGDMFTPSQLAGLIMLGVGAMKLYELWNAYDEGTSEDGYWCMAYLNDEVTCSHPSFPSMILAKFYSSVNLWVLTCIMIMVVWNSETYFSKLTTCLCMSPLSTTILGITMSQGDLVSGKYISMMLICFALLCTCVPNSREKIPFLSDKPLSLTSQPSMCLMALFAVSMFDVVRLSGGEFGRENALLETATLLPEKAKILVNFWCLDKLSMALIYLFALYHFPLGIQANFLFLVSGMKLLEGIVQMSMMSEPFQNGGLYQAITVATGIFAAVASMSPTKTKAE
ncbi:unnamed protein product [Cylindrotheca closterium]|uniref:Uncharacterized protein n=1 Tax=Cylindrotheca closterium TaxID=2856 RepID=A0AAD2FZZ5_9STRA|nr:unnamed protein product [Cylindrotheca closterium]